MQSDMSYYMGAFYTRLVGLEEGVVSPNKPKLVFLHGLLGNGQNWMPVARALEADFTVLLVDQRGHGRTQPVDGDFSPESFAKDLDQITTELGWEKFSLVGHSLGARVGFCFVSAYPEKIEKFVIEDMGPHRTGPASESTAEMIKSVPVPFATRKEAKDFFENKFKTSYGEVLSAYMYSNLAKTALGDYNWRFDKEGALDCIEIGKKRDFWTEFKAVKAKNLIIRGEKSEHLPRTVLDEMLNQNKASSAVEIKGAGHWVHFDQFKSFIKEVKAFLEN